MTRKSRSFWSRLTQAMKAQAVKTDAPQRLQPASAVRPLALEQRFMFDGAAVTAAADVAQGADPAAEIASGLRHGPMFEAQKAYGRLLSAPAGENFDDNPTHEIRGSNTFVLDGFRYTVTGPGGSNYDHFLTNVQFAPPGQGLGPDNYLRFDTNGEGATSIKIELADGSAFRLMGLSFFVEDSDASGGPSSIFYLTPAGGSALVYVTDTTHSNVDFSNNANFYNITSISFTSKPGELIYLDIDDLVIAAPITNANPIVASAISDQVARAETAFEFQFAANTFSDADAGDTLTYSARLTGGGALPAWLSFDTATRTFSGTPGRGDSGRFSIDVTAFDGKGGTATDTFDIMVTANAPPTIGNLHGDNVTYLEDGAPVLLDALSNASVTDADSANFNGGNVRVAVTGNAVTSEDVLSVFSLGTAAGQIYVSGSNVLYGGVAIGELTGGTGGNALVITLNANANADAVTALVRSLQYSNSNTTTPNTSARTLSITVTDETATTSTAAAVTVNILAINDAPSITNKSVDKYSDEDTAVSFSVLDFGFQDVDSGDTLQSITIVTAPSAGQLFIDANGDGVYGSGDTLLGNGAIVSAANIGKLTFRPLANANGMGYASFTWKVSDGTATSADVGTMTLNVIAVNDAPVIYYTSVNKYFSEDTAVSFFASDFSFQDVDSGDTLQSITIVTAPSAGQLFIDANGDSVYGSGDTLLGNGAIVSAANIGKLTFRPLANANGMGYASFTWKVSDGIATSANVGTMTFNVNPVNDAPTVSLPAGGLSTDEDCSLRITGINFADVDAGSNAVTVSLSVINGSLSATAMAGVGVAGANTNTLTLTGSIADINAFVTASRITYIPQLNFNGTVSLTASIRDDGGALTSGTTDITVNAVNDAPSITYTASLIGTEDQPLTILGISFSDVDAGTAPVTVTMSVPTGTLIAASSGNVTATGSGGNSLVLVGSIAEINAFISGQNISYIPVANATNDVAMTVHIDDGGNTGIEPGASGTANSESVQITQMLRFTAVDDAPTITANAVSQVVEDVATPLNQISLADVDSTSGTVTLSVTSGSLHAASGSGVTVGGTSSALTLTGTLASINSFIASNHLTYTTAANATADVTLNIAVNTDKIASTSMMLQVLAVNDAPTMTSSGGSAAFIEGADVASTPVVVDSGLTVSDNDSPLLYSASVKITGNLRPSEDVLGFTNDPATMGDISGSYNAATGTLTLTSASGASAAQWQAALRSVTYSNSSDTPDTITRSVSFRVSDGQLDSADATRSVTVTAANDSPQISLPGVISLSEDTTRAITGIVVSDVDAGTGNVQVTFTLPANSGTLIATASGTIAVGAALDTVILTGRVADINAYIAGMNLFYSPSANSNGNVTLGISISDLGNSGGPAKTDSGSLILQVDAVNDAPGTPVVPSLPVSGSEDVPLVLNGISFSDIDAGSGVVQATFSVAAGSGTFSALAGAGVTLTGSGTNQLVLSGSLSDINAFVASSQVSYLSAANASGTVIVTVSLDDRGNTGTGGAKVSSATFNLAISPVNDAPVNSVPGAQTVLSNETQVFSAGNGNAISISDVDVAGGSLRVTLVGINGLITLGSTSGLLFLAGDGTVDAIMTFDGSLADINNALAGLSFTPLAGYHGAASLQIISNDQGQTGSGGTQTDTDIISINVEQPNPRIVGVSAGNSDGTYKVGDLIAVQVQFDWSVFVDTSGGIPGLLLETGLVDREAVYVSGSGSNTLTFHYIVQAGDSSADLDAQSTVALQLNGAVLANANNDLAILTLPTIGGADSLGGRSDIVIDGVAPMVTSVSVPANGSYVAGQNLDFTVNFSESVIVDTSGGTPRIAVTLDTGGTVYAQYLSGSGGSALVFRLVVASGQLDTNGITLGTSIQTDGATLRDSAGNDINTGLNSVASTTGVLVDAVVPTVSSVSVPAGAAYNVGDTLTFTVNTSETVLVNGVPRLALDIGGNTVFANLVSGSGTSTLVFQYTVQAGDNDADGISVSASLDLNGGRVRDAAGNNLDLTLNGLGATSGVIVDTLRPTATIVVADTSLAVGETSLVTITFSEAVNDFTNTDLTVANGTLSNISSSDGGVTWTATFTPTANLESTVNLITLNNAGVADKAGNAGVGSTVSNGYAIDTLGPTATITVADTALAVGETSTVTITFSEAVDGFDNSDLSVSGGTLSPVTSSDGGITWTATFTPTANLESTVNRIMLNNAGVADKAGNAGVGTTDSNNYAIDTLRPTATIVVADTSLAVGETSLVTITFSEAVSDFTNDDLTVSNGTLSAVSSSDGGVTWTATFTPTAGINSASNYVILDNTGVLDGAGNVGSGTTTSNNYGIDGVRPTATVAIDKSSLIIGQTAQVTITFSEAVTSFSNSDLTVSNGTLSAVSSSDGGVTWTATFTPAGNITSASNVITLGNTGYTDTAGNAGAGTSVSSNYAIDTQRPTAVIVVSDPTLRAGETSQVTITFSEAVTGFTLGDLNAGNGTLSNLSSSDGGITWTATFTPNANTSSGTNVIILANTGIFDIAGNSGAGTTSSVNYSIDTVRPTATIVVANPALKIGDTSQVTITFSQAVSGFTNADLTVVGGTLSAVSSADGGVTWTATFTPAGNISNAANLITLDNSGVNAASSGNTGTGLTTSNNYVIDTQRPTATIVVAKDQLGIGGSSQVTIIFSEAVTGFSLADLTAGNGTLSNLTTSDNITWTATLTPAVGVDAGNNHVSLDNTGVTDIAGNAGSGTTDSNAYAVDSIRPTATIVINDPTLSAGESTTVTITFSEAVTGLDNTDLSVPNGTLGTLSSSDGGITWTATYTPNTNVRDTSNVIVLNNTGYTDLAGNAGVSVTNSANFTIDTVRPTATIVVANPALNVGATSLVTITFSEAVSGFTNADLVVSNGTLSAVSSSDGGVTWTATFTPSVNIADTTNVLTLDNSGVQNASGNAGSGATTSNNYSIDTLRPTATITVANPNLGVGQATMVTIAFSEVVSGFSQADLSVANGVLSNLASSDGGKTWTATLTPTAAITDPTNLIVFDTALVSDNAGNAGVGIAISNNYAVDTLRPTATIVVADAALQAGETTTVTITFSEAVNDFTNTDLSVSGGTLSPVTSSDGGITWTATFTPTANLESTVNRITLSNAGVTDKAGNAGVGTTDSNNYAVDTLRPTATIVVADAALQAGESTLVTITFSEAVTGLDVGDFTVANGSLSNLMSSDGGLTWMATLTPTAGITDATNVIGLNNASYTDLAGNTGSGTTDSNNFAIDTLRPTATIVVADAALAVGETTMVTITFSEAVNDFTNADLSVSGGTLSTVTSSDGGVTWIATFTPAANLESTVNRITLNNTGVTDKAGNAGVGTSDSNNYAIDTLRPTATIVVADAALQAGETTTVTITFSEAVNDFTNTDLSVSGGTLSPVTSSDGGITWTATFTPTANLESTVNRIMLNNAGVADKAGNAGVGTIDSNNYAVDTLRPTATITVADTALAVGETSTITITFSEAVNGFTNADLTVANGTLSNVSSSDGGITWTATFTPTANTSDASNLITLDNSGVTDAAGNAGSGTTDSNNYAIDTLRPTATIMVADNNLRIGETSLVTITFSEAVTGFTNADLTVANGTLSNVSSSDGGITWTATFTPTSNITDASNLITLDNTEVTDAAGNAGSGTTDSNNYAIDTLRPTATIVVADNNLRIGETSLVTITFSEAVTGFTNADLTVANGTLSNVSSSDGGITWTATFTPTANTSDASNLITLDNSGVTDAAGNAGSGTTDSNNYAIDTQRPTANIVVNDTALAVGESSTVIITFSEAVTGLDIGDFTVANGSLSNLSSSDGVTWTATLTPTASITDASNVITLNNTGYMDAAGNSGIGTAISNSYAIDTLDPVAPEITLDQATLVNGRQVSPTGLVFISGLETGGSWQYSLDNGVSWLEGRGNSLQLPGLGAFSLWVQQRDVAGNASSVTSLSGVVEPLVSPAVHAPFAFAVSNSSDGLGLAPFQPSEVPEPNADFLHPASMMLGSVSRDTGMPRQDSWSEYGLPQSIAGVNDWMWASLFAPAEPNRSGFDPAPEQFSVASGGSTLDLKPVLLASESPWDIESLQFSFSGKQELPGWVRLDRHSGQLTINAPKDLSTTLVLQIKVSDGKGHESVRTVKVVIGDARATSSAPAGRAGLSEKMANAANQQVGKRMSMYVHG